MEPQAELSEAQQRQLDLWNDTVAPLPEAGSLHALIASHAARTPQAEAILGAHPLTYAQLLERSTRLARVLVERGVGRGDIVGVWVREPVAGVLSCLATWFAGAALVPMDDALPEERVRFMLGDSAAKILLTEQALLATLGAPPCPFVCVDATPAAAADSIAALPTVEAEDLAYVIYTSGSTGRPKGVAIRHGNIVNFVVARSRIYGPAPRYLPIHSLAFDPTMGGLAFALGSGGALLMVDAETRRDPEALRVAISRHRVTHLSSVPPLYAAIVRDAMQGELSCLVACAVGGERLPPTLAEAHYTKLPGAGLFNEYGPTETTVSSTVYRVPRGAVPDPIPIGRPLANTTCYVLDEQRRRVAPGESGELYIGGAGVGAGYLNRPELTAERFVPDPFSSKPGARLYRTGDRARWLADGQLEFQGRLDFQVKVRGHRVELQEIELCIENCEGVRAAVVVLFEQGASSNLAAYYTTDDGQPRAALKEALSAALPQYMVPAFLKHMPELPINSAGKVDRRALPDPSEEPAARKLDAAEPVLTRGELALAEIWRDVLSIERVRPEDDFFMLGGNSLSGTMVVSRVREQLGLRVPVRCLFAAPTLRAFTLAVEREGKTVLRGHSELNEQQLGEVPIAPLQETFWYLAQIDPSSAAYVVGAKFRIRGALDAARLARALATLVAGNEVLRTRFVVLQGEPIQVVVPVLKVPLEQHDLRAAAEPEGRARAHLRELVHQPFDLGACPLLRCQLLRLGDEDHILGFAVHHIIFDGWSVSLLLQQLFAAYAAAEQDGPVAPRASYRSHSHIARMRLEGVRLDELRSYWRAQLSELPPPLSLRPDFAQEAATRERGGASVRGLLSPQLTQRLRARCVESGVTHFVFCLAVFKLIVARWTGSRDVVVGTPMAVRDERHLETMIGCFVNSVVLRTRVPELSEPFSELLRQVRSTVVGGLAHAELPFDWLVADLKPERTRRNENPLFRLFFNDIDRRRELPEIPGIAVSQVPDEDPISKFDLTFYVHEWAEHDELELVYDPALFSATHMQELVAQFENVVEQAVQDSARPLGAYRLTTARARVVLPDPGAALDATLGDGLLQQALYTQAHAHPARVALVDRTGAVSYGELIERANAVALALVQAGAQPGDRVAVYAPRSAALVVGLIGVLEAGCLFTILDPDQPGAWNRRLLESLGARGWLCLGDAKPPPELAQEVERHIAVRVRSDGLARGSSRVAVPRSPDSPAYVIFTSGTTGGPKAVMGSHRPVVHFVDWYAQSFGIASSDRFSMLSGLGHDPLLRDIFTPLSVGAALCIPTAEIRKEPEQLGGWLNAQAVSVVHLTPSLGTVIAAAQSRAGVLEALRLMLFGGERLRNQDVALARRYAPNARIVNCYGTTETPQVMGYCEVAADANEFAPAVGKGVGDTQLLVVNPNGELAGIAELGTIHVRSPYLSYGYVAAGAADAPATKADVYVTGDLGHYDAEGRVRFMGRDDRQAKVRGHRVELSAIEAALEALPGVNRAHVLVREAGDGSSSLEAHIVAAPTLARDSAKLRSALHATLVEAMIPSSFAFLEKLPLTANGKVDSKRLLAESTAQPISRPPYREPRSQSEEVIARLWEELFELDRVGIDDDFFELGGHSLLAVRMTGTLSERLATSVPITLLANHSTVGSLAVELHRRGSIAEEKLVVELRTGGARPPFWLIHPVGGYVVFARRLVALLDPEQNMLGIQAQGLDGRKEPFESLQEMARHYLELIRTYQPSGPYYIGGPSLGGKVCYEIAQQLVAGGEEPGMVVLFDTFAPGFPETKAPIRWLRDKLAHALEDGWKNSAARLGQRLLGRATPRGYVDYQAAELDERFGATLRKVIGANQRASRSYESQPYPGVITLFRASQQPNWPGMDFSDLTNGWKRFAARVDVEVVDTTHQHMFDEPAVQELVRKFSACQQRAYQRTALRVSRISTMGGTPTRVSDPSISPRPSSQRPPARKEPAET